MQPCACVRPKIITFQKPWKESKHSLTVSLFHINLWCVFIDSPPTASVVTSVPESEAARSERGSSFSTSPGKKKWGGGASRRQIIVFQELSQGSTLSRNPIGGDTGGWVGGRPPKGWWWWWGWGAFGRDRGGEIRRGGEHWKKQSQVSLYRWIMHLPCTLQLILQMWV